MSIEAMKQALEALELHAKQYPHMQKGYTVDATTALRQAIAEVEKQEPVAWRWRVGDSGWQLEDVQPRSPTAQPLYTHPPKREWVGLTDEEIKPLCDENHIIYGAYTVDFIQAIEAKLKEKNT